MESYTALQADVIYRNPWQTEELFGEQNEPWNKSTTNSLWS